MRKFLPLKPSDIIDVIAPGRVGAAEDISAIQQFIAAQGFSARIPEDIIGSDLLCSNNDDVRARHLIAALTAEDSKAVWCARGGYGAARIIEALKTVKKPKKTKWFIGFSDNTALHLFLNQHWGWPTLHAPVLYQIAQGKVDVASVAMTIDVLKGEFKKIKHALRPMNSVAEKNKTIRAPIVGGNMTLVQCSIGTFWQVNAKKKILFLEDCDERDYRIDRMLVQFAQAGIFKQVKAIVFGAFTAETPEQEQAQIAVLKRFAEAQNTPVFHTEMIGHRSTNHPLLLGSKAKLKGGLSAPLECRV